jgi:hypothetical protein
LRFPCCGNTLHTNGSANSSWSQELDLAQRKLGRLDFDLLILDSLLWRGRGVGLKIQVEKGCFEH